MQFRKRDDIFQCYYNAGNIACLLGLEFSVKKQKPDVIIRDNNCEHNQFDSKDVIHQVECAIAEKEKEYNRPFYLKTIEYAPNIALPSLTEHVIYYRFACMIIDRMMNSSEYEGTGIEKG